MEHALGARVARAAGLRAARAEPLRLALLVVLVELLGVGVGAKRVSGAHVNNLVLLRQGNNNRIETFYNLNL